MTLFEKIKEKIKKFLRVQYSSENPESIDNVFINDEQLLEMQKIREYKAWASGDDDALNNFYLVESIYGFVQEPIYLKNRNSWFRSIAAFEEGYKVCHSGLGAAMISTAVNVVGDYKVNSANEQLVAYIDEIEDDIKLSEIIKEQELPSVLTTGQGAIKIVFDTDVSKGASVQVYDAENCEFIIEMGKVVGIIFKDYLTYEKENYVLLETRRIGKEGSVIEFELYKQKGGSNSVVQVPLDTIPELANHQNILIEGSKRLTAVPCVIFEDTYKKGKGRSFLHGLPSQFDSLDQVLSQANMTIRVSTPVEYYPADVLDRGKNGRTTMPKRFYRQYIKKSGIPDADGRMNSEITTTQPQINADQYANEATRIIANCLLGKLSPCSMGIDLARQDNAEAQREKEKTTIATRNKIISKQKQIIKETIELLIIFNQYLETGIINLEQSFDFSIDFDEFANPSFEERIGYLSSIYASGGISEERYVDEVWHDKLDEETMQKEIEYLKGRRESDNFAPQGLGDMVDDFSDKNGNDSREEEEDY